MNANVKAAREAVERRNLVVPQMRDYDELGRDQQWVPHLMYFHPRNASYPSVTTDDRGLRTTVGHRRDASSTALLVGSSSVFGIGATSDAATISSRLNALTSCDWMNLGGRAFNSTQEVLLIHLLNLDRVRGPIVVMSGINNLTRVFLQGSFSSMYGAFFQQSFFEQQMMTAAVGNRALARLLVNGIIKKLKRPATKAATTQSSSVYSLRHDSYASMLTVFRRDCEYLQMFAKRHGTTPAFVLQPFVPWLGKQLSSEEVELFALLDEESEDFMNVLRELTQHGDQYRKDLRAICDNIGMRFFDLNDAPELKGPQWLFVDRAHFTDKGYDTVAQLLVRDLSL